MSSFTPPVHQQSPLLSTLLIGIRSIALPSIFILGFISVLSVALVHDIPGKLCLISVRMIRGLMKAQRICENSEWEFKLRFILISFAFSCLWLILCYYLVRCQ